MNDLTRYMSGLLVAVEGIEGSGKTTFSKKLVKEINRRYGKLGIQAVYTYEPTNGQYGRLVKEILQGRRKPSFEAETLLLFVLDRAEHVKNFILPHLERGFIVVVDRYIHSNLAYQMAEGVDINIISFLNKDFPKPHIVFYLDCDVKTALKRIYPRYHFTAREAYDRRDFLELVRHTYYYVLIKKMFVEYGCVFLNSTDVDVDSLVSNALSKLDAYLKPIARIRESRAYKVKFNSL